MYSKEWSLGAEYWSGVDFGVARVEWSAVVMCVCVCVCGSFMLSCNSDGSVTHTHKHIHMTKILALFIFKRFLPYMGMAAILVM